MRDWLSHFHPLRSTPALRCQSLSSLRSQLEFIQGSLDKATLTDYVHRVTQLWTDGHMHSQQQPHSAQTQLQRSHSINAAGTTAPISLPPLPILSSSSLQPLRARLAHSAQPASSTSAHPLADASNFTALHTRPARPTTSQLRSELFDHSAPSAAAPAPHPDDLSSEQERGLDALSELAPQLKAQVRAIAAHLKVDEAVVADTSGMLEANVLSVKRENVRLKAWARASCGETCQLTGMIVFVLLMFTLQLLIMKIFPAPRS